MPLLLKGIELWRRAIPTTLPALISLPTPSNVKVTGSTGFFIVQWSLVSEAEGYRIAVMTDKNIAKPDIGLFAVTGYKTVRFDYIVGNIALTRNFAVQAFSQNYFSPFSPIVSATNSLMTAAGAAEPAGSSPASGSGEGPPSGSGGSGSPIKPLQQ